MAAGGRSTRRSVGVGGIDDDPLDADGVRPNPLTGQPYSAARATWARTWRKFPLYADKPKLRALQASLAGNQVTVVVSGTGSGKTVLAVPIALMYAMRATSTTTSRPLKVAVTIPKRVLVQEAAKTGALTLDVQLGQEVGYQHRGSPSSAFSASRTRLVYATDGTLLAQVRKDPMLSEYAAVVVDEAHERPVPTDLLLLALRAALRARPELRLVVMSATIDPKPFLEYYRAAGVSADAIEVSGVANHPIEVRHQPPTPASPTPGEDALASGLAAVRRIATEQPTGPLSVLLFVPVTRDATTGCRLFGVRPKPRRAAARGGGGGGCDSGCDSDSDSESFLEPLEREGGGGRNNNNKRRHPPGGPRGQPQQQASPAAAPAPPPIGDCAALFGKMSDEDKEAVLGDEAVRNRPERMLFIATNVAESSLTIRPGVTHVVDTGLQLVSRWDAAAHGTVIEKAMATRAQITQRVGRTGRVAPGVAVLLYSKERLEAQPAFPPPAILQVDLTEHALAALARPGPTTGQTLGQVFAELASMLTPPTVEQMQGAARFMQFYGLVSDAVPSPSLGKPDGVGGGKKKAASKAAASKAASKVASKVVEGGEEQKLAMLCRSLAAVRLTAFGRWTQRACEELKLGVWNALLLCMAAAHRCPSADLVDLALALESCGGEMGTLFQQRLPAVSAAVAPFLDRRSDHFSMLRVLRGLVRPMLHDERERRAPRAEANEALRLAGLSPPAWRGIDDRLRRDGARASRFVALAAEDPELLVGLPAALRPAPANAKTKAPTKDGTAQARVEAALASARLYHLAVCAGGGAGDDLDRCPSIATLMPAKRVRADVDPMFARQARPDHRGGVAFYEQLTSSSGKNRASCVTWLPAHAAAAAWAKAKGSASVSVSVSVPAGKPDASPVPARKRSVSAPARKRSTASVSAAAAVASHGETEAPAAAKAAGEPPVVVRRRRRPSAAAAAAATPNITP